MVADMGADLQTIHCYYINVLDIYLNGVCHSGYIAVKALCGEECRNSEFIASCIVIPLIICIICGTFDNILV
ncbi:unnamed protein product, partial [Cylicocyclus nassatus]